MAYFLKKTVTKKGVYLQIYESYRNKEKKQTAHKAFKSIGYVDDLRSDKIPDPISYYQNFVKKMNEKRKKEIEESKIKQIEDEPTKNLGYFLVKSVFNTLRVESHLNLLARIADKPYDLNEAITSLVSARVVSPCSKIKTMEEVIPSFLEPTHFSSDQLYDSILPFIGDEYERILEIINHAFNKKYGRKTDNVFFDGTNYYFEIDREKDDKRKGPSKENRADPIISMGLLLDEEQIPLAMKMFPGNESEKPVMRNIISTMKEQNNINGRTIQVADKGLNCTKNICEALKNGDGYIFSQSIKRLSDQEKKWALLENDENKWLEVKDKDGTLLYKYKSCIDKFSYKVDDGTNRPTIINLTQKRVVTFNPKLAEKKRYEIDKMIEKARELNNSQAKRKEYGDAAKYVTFKAISNEGEVLDDTAVKATINQDKVNEDLKLAGYNLLVTSETKMRAEEIYKVYHRLWRIEETFRTLKSELDARPVYLQRQDSIYGHFLICYLAVFALRVLQIKEFKDEIHTNEIISFVRNLKVLKNGETYINLGSKDKIKKINDRLGLNLTNYFLTDKNIKKVLSLKL
ncbi:MAG: IS1634 family transposase [Bacilli bacterium]|nr:IS1634 family transposase [Bacilli bacterium]